MTRIEKKTETSNQFAARKLATFLKFYAPKQLFFARSNINCDICNDVGVPGTLIRYRHVYKDVNRKVALHVCAQCLASEGILLQVRRASKANKKCNICGSEMELVDEDPELGKYWSCECGQAYIQKGPGNAFDSNGWQKFVPKKEDEE